ncbi:MAG: hypothetical protein F6K10_18190 [Moorea sp. SIO2B7]|nr:hypothetical protein [Moorena sp. SIO2B7]
MLIVTLKRKHNRNYYRLLLALAQQHLDQIPDAIAPDNATIAIVTSSMLQSCSIEGQLLAIIPNQGSDLSLTFSPDGELLAYHPIDSSKTIWVWYKDSKRIHSFGEHLTYVSQVVFSPNSQTLVSLSQDGMVQLWRQNGTRINTLQTAGDNEDYPFSNDDSTGISCTFKDISFVCLIFHVVVAPSN